MPVKLNCTVKTNMESKYKLIWMKGDEFMTGNGYSIESTPFDSINNTQNHYLTIHKASPGDYTCMLISTASKVIDSKTQHVVTESEYTLLTACLVLHSHTLKNVVRIAHQVAVTP